MGHTNGDAQDVADSQVWSSEESYGLEVALAGNLSYQPQVSHLQKGNVIYFSELVCCLYDVACGMYLALCRHIVGAQGILTLCFRGSIIPISYMVKLTKIVTVPTPVFSNVPGQ